MLINSAGLIQQGYTASPEMKRDPGSEAVTASGPPGVVADVVTSVLMYYLERSVPR